ncbi:MAG: phage holin family protein [Austwickia sp.]|jgi:hypothetical protein|nr:phage holin family protein [Austwickia sp.]MBK8437784.1 phage holin family protein [Austwickia sp.]MBK9100092.1 phage holin family protein [Austwickia sp.]
MATSAPEPVQQPTVSLPPLPGASGAPAADEPTIGKLVADATSQLSSIVRNEIALAKTEVSVDVKKIGKGGAFLAVAAVTAVFSLIYLLHSLAWVFMALGLPGWAGYGIVFLLLIITAAVFGLLGKNALAKVQGKPERTIASTKETIETVKAAGR